MDVSGLHVGHSLHVRDVVPPEGVKIRNRPEAVIAAVAGKPVEVVAEAEAAEGEEAAAAEAEGEAKEAEASSGEGEKD